MIQFVITSKVGVVCLNTYNILIQTYEQKVDDHPHK